MVFTSPTLDRIMQVPGQPDKDRCRDRAAVFADGGPLATLRLLDSVTTTTGVLVATYQPTRTNGGHEHLGLNENAIGGSQ